MKLTKNKMRNKLLVCILLPIIAIFIVTQVSIDRIIRPYLEELLIDRTLHMAERRVEQINSLESQLSNTAQSIIGNETMQMSLSGSGFAPAQIERILQLHVFDNILNITYVTSDLNHIYNAYPAYVNSQWVLELIRNTDLSGNYAKPIWMKIDQGKDGESRFYVLQKLRHLSVNVRPGYLLYQVRQEPLERIITTDGESERVFILNSDGDIMYPRGFTTDEMSIPTEILSHVGGISNRIWLSADKEYFATVYTSFRIGWSVVSYAKYNDVMKRYSDMQSLITYTTALILIASSALILLLALHYTRPIVIITRALASFENGKFQTRIENRLSDEFEIISDTFNGMADRIDTLISDVEKSREDLKTAELDSLMYQINPHFIYNTLSNMYMLARMSGNDQLTLLIHSLSSFLRISLSKGSSIVTVQSEVEHVSCYLMIQQARYNGLFTFSVDVNIGVSQLTVLKFILQPIVENSISHGFSGIANGGVIEVKAYAKDNGVCFEISDNGIGIASDTLNGLNSIGHLSSDDLRNLFRESEGGYGIWNVIARLQLYYGGGYRLTFENTCPGTKCTIWIKNKGDVTIA
ncbi:MAG: histidine kinase [Oscillospiraceae bacterium]|nr:histidine kinase [Oscillospiraceae bacterium]